MQVLLFRSGQTSLCDNQISGCDVRYLEMIFCDSLQNLRTFMFLSLLFPQHLAESLCCLKVFFLSHIFFPQKRFLCVWGFPLVMQVCYAYPKSVVLAIFYRVYCVYFFGILWILPSVFVMFITLLFSMVVRCY